MSRQDWFSKWLRYALALLPVWLMDSFILTRFPLWGVTPMLLPVAVAVVAVLEGVEGGAGFGFGVGLLWATAYAGGVGSRVLVLMLVGMFAGALARHALARSLLGSMICCGAAVAVIQLIYGAADLFFVRVTLWEFICVAAPQLLCSLAWTPVVYLLFHRVYDRVGGDKLA